jgi:hypothetical protein
MKSPSGKYRKITHKAAMLLLAALLLSSAIPGGAAAAEAGAGKGWDFGAALYLWGASIGGGTVTGSDIDVEFSDLMENLKMAFMGSFGARHGRWSLLADVMYLNVGDAGTVTGTLPSGPDVSLHSDVNLRNWIVTPAVAYTFVDNEQVRLDVMGGARYLGMDVDIVLDLNPPAPTTRREISDSGSVWDAIAGVRGSLGLGRNWYLPFHLDVGTGQSDLTWQAMGGIGYSFGRFDVVVAYRYLEWEFEKDSEVLADLNISGPMAGIKFAF